MKELVHNIDTDYYLFQYAHTVMKDLLENIVKRRVEETTESNNNRQVEEPKWVFCNLPLSKGCPNKKQKYYLSQGG